MLERLAAESGIATAEDPIRLDRQRQGKRRSNQDWTSPSDPQAKIAKTKDGRTRLADKPEHAVDLDTAVIVAAEIHPANRSDTTTLPQTLEAAPSTLVAVDAGPTAEDPAELIADKGHPRATGSRSWKTAPGRAGSPRSRIAEKKVRGVHRWHGMPRPDARSTTTVPSCAQASPRKRSSAGPSRSSAALPSPSTAVACVGHGSVAARTCASAIRSTSPATISARSCGP